MIDAHRWPSPEPLSAGDSLPSFPVDALPAWLKAWVVAEAEAVQVAPEMAAGFALGALSTLIAPRVRVAARADWIESTNLFIGVVADPGERKSPVLTHAFAPVRKLEKERIERARPELSKLRALRDALEAEIAGAKQALAKGKCVRERHAELVTELDATPEVHAPRMLVGDITPEALVEQLAAQSGAIAIVSGEDSMLGHLAGRYSAAPAIEVFLSAYSGEAVSVDRRGRAPIRVESPRLTVCVAMQPSIVAAAFGEKAIKGRGLLDRFVLLAPPSQVGSRSVDAPEMPYNVRESYEQALRGIDAQAAALGDAGAILGLSPPARAAWNAWRARQELELGPGGRLYPMRGWAAKSDGRCLRLAALLHVAEHRGEAFSSQIDELSMTRAVAIMGALEAHALVVADAVGADPTLELARNVLRWALRETGPGGSFSTRDAYRAFLGTAREVSAVRAALAKLAERHLIARVEPERKAGRPSERWQLSPRAREVLPAEPAWDAWDDAKILRESDD